jgi:hypothetical protein
LLQMGTDIEDTKCTWLIVQALQRADESQKKCLQVMCYLQCLVSCSMMWYDSSTIQVDEHGSFSDAQNCQVKQTKLCYEIAKEIHNR